LNYNVGGIVSKLGIPEFRDFVSKHDVICLTETFVHDDFQLNTFPDFVVFQAPAKKICKQGRRSGGIIVLVRKCYSKYFHRRRVEYENIIVLEMSGQLLSMNKPVMCIFAYIPPYDSPVYNNQSHDNPTGIDLLEQCILDLTNMAVDFYILICGDLNARTAQNNSKIVNTSIWHSGENETFLPRLSRDSVINGFGKQLLAICDSVQCSLLNGAVMFSFDDCETYISPTGASVIDVFILSNELCAHSVLESLHVDSSLIDSHHMPVILTIKVNADFKQFNKQESTVIWGEKLIWNKDKVSTFVTCFRSVDIQSKLNNAKNNLKGDPGRALQTLVDCLKEASVCMVKRVKFNDKQVIQKWFDAECFKLRKEARLLLRKYCNCKNEVNRFSYLQVRNNYKTVIKKKKQDFKLRKAQMLTDNLNNPSIFWKELRACCGLVKKQALKNSITINEWRDHFMNVFESNSSNNQADYESAHSEVDSVCIEELDNPISVEEVVKSIKRLKSGKAGGLDGILPEMLKEASTYIALFLTEFFNDIFTSGTYPEPWSEAVIVPIYKKGDANLTANYRGISLLNLLGKCYTSILNNRLYSWLEDSSKIIDSQAGFRKGYSTTDHIFTLYAVTQKYLLKRGGKLYVAFIDLKIAFDSIRRSTMLGCLKRVGISSKFLNAIMGIYQKVVSCVRINNELTEMFDCPKGLRQGCCLSPTIFSVIINEVAVRVSEDGRHGIQMMPGFIELLIMLFADDIALMSFSPSGLQSQLDLLNTLCTDLDLSINSDKSKIMVFRHGGYLSKYEKWYIDGCPLEVVNNYIYLGYKFTTTMSSIETAKHLAVKGRHATYNTIRAYNQLQNMTSKTFFKIFDTMIQPILSYSSEVWGILVEPEKDPTEKIHLLACKRLLNVALRTPNKMTYGDLGRYPLRINYYVKALKYWFRLIQMDEGRLPKQAYKMLVALDINGKLNWVTKLRTLICRLGFSYVWLCQGVGNETSFIKCFRQRLVDTYTQEWHDGIVSSDRFILYRDFKNTLCIERYLDCINQKCFRDTLIRVRFGISNLRVHKNRYVKNASCVNNHCSFCPNVDDDELHMMFVCPAYNNFRSPLLSGIAPYNQRSQYVTLMSSQRESIIRHLAWFFFKCFQIHDS